MDSCLKETWSAEMTAALEYFSGRMQRRKVVVADAADSIPSVAEAMAADWLFLNTRALPAEALVSLAVAGGDAVVVLVSPEGVAAPDEASLHSAADFRIDWHGPGQPVEAKDLSLSRMDDMKAEIAGLYLVREQLKAEMEAWYSGKTTGGTPTGRFPGSARLVEVGDALSRLDTCFKRQWDARHRRGNAG